MEIPRSSLLCRSNHFSYDAPEAAGIGRRRIHLRYVCCKLHLAEIAQIALPIDWAMCEALWYGMTLVAHPHGYPHAIHIFCGH
jgi:hypothetical protein